MITDHPYLDNNGPTYLYGICDHSCCRRKELHACPHEVRRVVELPGADMVSDCVADHGAGHIDCPKCWSWSPRNPNARPRGEGQ